MFELLFRKIKGRENFFSCQLLLLLPQVLVIRLLLLVGLTVSLLANDRLGDLVASYCNVPGVQVFRAFFLELVIVLDVSIGILVHIGLHTPLMVAEAFYGQILEVWI